MTVPRVILCIGRAMDPVATCLPTALFFFFPDFRDWLLPFLLPSCLPTAFDFFSKHSSFFFFLNNN